MTNSRIAYVEESVTASSALLSARLKRLGCAARVCWARPELSGDNACGVALIGEEHRRVQAGGGE